MCNDFRHLILFLLQLILFIAISNITVSPRINVHALISENLMF